MPVLKANGDSDVDGGIQNRMVCLKFMNRFVDAKKVEAEQKKTIKGNVYELDVEITELFNKDEYKFALLEMLIDAGNEYIKYHKESNGRSLLLQLLPIEFAEFKENILNKNNPLIDFVNEHFIITNDKNDRIGRDEFFAEIEASQDAELIKEFNNKLKRITPILDNEGIEYVKNLRYVFNGESKQGVFLKLKKINT